MPRTRYKIYDNRYPHFLTCTVVGWLPVFTRTDTRDILLNSWRYLQDQGRITLYGYVILENHVHWIASADDLSKEVGDFKSFTARRMIDLLNRLNIQTLLKQIHRLKLPHKSDREFQLWQEGSHPQMMFSDDVMRQKLEYIHNNPVKRGYIDDPTHWRYSSARNYAKMNALLPVQTDW